MRTLKKRGVYTFLRLGSLGSKLLFLLVINKYFEADSIVTFYLINFTLVFLVYLANLDLSTINARTYFSPELSGLNQRKAELINFHFSFIALSALVGALLSFFYFSFAVGVKIGVYAALIFIVEYVTKDLERWLVLLDKQVSSALSLFLRTAGWIMLSVSAILAGLQYMDLVYSLYIVFGFLSLWYCMRCISPEFNIKPVVPSIRRVVIAARESSKIFASVLLTKFVFAMDKQLVAHFVENPDEAAAYVFFFSFAYLVLTLCEIMIFNFELPTMLKARAALGEQAKRVVRPIVTKASLMVVGAAVSVVAASYVSILLTNKEVYLQYMTILILLVVAVALYCVQQVIRYWLYVSKKDNQILIASSVMVLMFIITLLLLFQLVSIGVAESVATSILVAVMSSMMVSVMFYRAAE